MAKKVKKIKKKKPIFKRASFWIVIVILLLFGFGGSSDNKDKQPEQTQEVEQVKEDSAEPVKENPLDKINLSKEDKIKVFLALQDAFMQDDNPANDLENYTSDKVREWESSVMENIGKDYGITKDEVVSIYSNATYGYLYDYDTSKIKLISGDVLEARITDVTLIVKAKIKPGWSNENTIELNYSNVYDIIMNQGGDQFETVSYWAVADMTDGSEGKVIGFNVSKNLMNDLKAGKIRSKDMGDYVENLWILQSLL